MTDVLKGASNTSAVSGEDEIIRSLLQNWELSQVLNWWNANVLMHDERCTWQ